jgi:hypothetical protein
VKRLLNSGSLKKLVVGAKSPQPQRKNMIGETIAQFRIIEKIGSGGEVPAAKEMKQ